MLYKQMAQRTTAGCYPMECEPESTTEQVERAIIRAQGQLDRANELKKLLEENPAIGRALDLMRSI